MSHIEVALRDTVHARRARLVRLGMGPVPPVVRVVPPKPPKEPPPQLKQTSAELLREKYGAMRPWELFPEHPDVLPKKLEDRIRLIKRKVCLVYFVEYGTIESGRRSASCVRPRQMAAYLLRELLGLSYLAIARQVGCSDHTGASDQVRRTAWALGSAKYGRPKRMQREPYRDETLARELAEICQLLGIQTPA